jgi:hypothetical protein
MNRASPSALRTGEGELMRRGRALPLFIAVGLLAAMSLAACVPKKHSAPTGSVLLAVVVKKAGQSQALSVGDLQQMPSVAGAGCLLTSSGQVLGPYHVKGVKLVDLCELVGGLGPKETVRVQGRDGYAMNFSHARIAASDFAVFDARTGESVSHTNLFVLLAYEMVGGRLNPEAPGLPRSVVLAGTNQCTEGHWWVKDVGLIEIVPDETP